MMSSESGVMFCDFINSSTLRQHSNSGSLVVPILHQSLKKQKNNNTQILCVFLFRTNAWGYLQCEFWILMCLLKLSEWLRQGHGSESWRHAERLDHVCSWISWVNRRGCLPQQITRENKGGFFSLRSPFEQPYSWRSSSSDLAHSGGFNRHAGPVASFCQSMPSPQRGGLSIPLCSIKFTRMRRFVPLICILSPREAGDQRRIKPSARRQAGRL